MKTPLLLSLSFLLCLASCASPPSDLLAPLQNLPQIEGISHEVNNLTVILYPINKTDPERQKFYEDFNKKGILPLQISINNPTDHFYSLEKVQYAICDPDYNRIRRMSSTSMALANTEMVYPESNLGESKKIRKKKKKLASQMKKQFKKFEFKSGKIPPLAQVNGWLYFQVKEGEFNQEEFFAEIKGYQLEIAHIKDLETNIVNNLYLALDDLNQ